MTILKKIVLDDGYEYLDPSELIDETNEKSFGLYTLAKCVCDVLNYFQENSPDAFGNAPYARLVGYMNGYIHGCKMDLEKEKDIWTIRKGSRKVLCIEVPKKPQSYYDDLKDNTETIAAVFR